MRDHLLGYAASAAHSAELEYEFETYGETFDYQNQPHPLGTPTRIRHERAAQRVAWVNSDEGRRVRAIEYFHDKVFSNPDGTCTPAKDDKAQSKLAAHMLKTNPLYHTIHDGVGDVVRMKGISVKPAPGCVISTEGIHAIMQRRISEMNADMGAALQGGAAMHALIDQRMQQYNVQRQQDQVQYNREYVDKAADFEHHQQARQLAREHRGWSEMVGNGMTIGGAELKFSQCSVPIVMHRLEDLTRR